MKIHARFVIGNPQTILEHATVEFDGHKIRSVRPARGSVDGPDIAILPGLVNAHTHLELSAMRGKIRPTRRFEGWLAELVQEYRQWSSRDWTRSVHDGLDRLARNGITSAGDICRNTRLLPLLRRDPIRKVVYLEALHPDPAHADRVIEPIKTLVDRFRPSATTAIGLSPHAPYSVSAELFRQCLALARRHDLPMAVHLSESRDEIELLRSGTGALTGLLQHANLPLPFAKPPRRTPVEYLTGLGILSTHTTLIHGNYLTDRDIEKLRKVRTPVVFCPCSHRFFYHDPHPVRKLLRAGVCVALGTDSLASNEDLSILREMSLVRKYYRIAPEEILKMATRNGAMALFGAKIQLGEIRPGWMADLTVVRVPAGMKRRDLLEYLCTEIPKVAATIVNGKRIYP